MSEKCVYCSGYHSGCEDAKIKELQSALAESERQRKEFEDQIILDLGPRLEEANAKNESIHQVELVECDKRMERHINRQEHLEQEIEHLQAKLESEYQKHRAYELKMEKELIEVKNLGQKIDDELELYKAELEHRKEQIETARMALENIANKHDYNCNYSPNPDDLYDCDCHSTMAQEALQKIGC